VVDQSAEGIYLKLLFAAEVSSVAAVLSEWDVKIVSVFVAPSLTELGKNRTFAVLFANDASERITKEWNNAEGRRLYMKLLDWTTVTNVKALGPPRSIW